MTRHLVLAVTVCIVDLDAIPSVSFLVNIFYFVFCSLFVPVEDICLEKCW